jgi:hypothetical protein
LDYNFYILYPLFLLVVTCSQPLYIESYSPLCMCRFVPLHEFVYIVLPTCFILSNQVCVCWLHTMYGCSCWAIFAYCLYLVGSCEILMDHPILGEWYALAFHNPKNMCTWGIPLSVYILNYLVSMWYVMLMRNSNSNVH